MAKTWGRGDVELGMVVTRDDLDRLVDQETPLLYKVVAIVDEPMVVVRPLFERDGEDEEHYVIASPAFAEFSLVRAGDEPGQFTCHFGEAS